MADAQPAIVERMALKPGWKTTEFWTTIVTGVGPFLIEGLPTTWKAGLSVVAGGVYAIARGLAKLGIRPR